MYREGELTGAGTGVGGSRRESWRWKLLRLEGETQALSFPLQCILGILGLSSDEEESDDDDDDDDKEEEEGFFSVIVLSPFLFLLRRKFPLSNIFSQFGSRVQ